MSEVKSYKNLEVWIQSKSLALDIYRLTESFPKTEQYGLISQLRRSAVSVPSNIAEGCGRRHYNDSRQFLFIARGALYEIETQLEISSDLKFLSKEEFSNLLSKIIACKRLLNGFINYYQGLSGQKPGTINEQPEWYGNNN